MDSFLLYKDSYTDSKKYYYSPNDIIRDLNLDIVFRTMAGDDIFVAEKARKIILMPLKTPEEIYYRHNIINDFINYPKLLEDMYDCALRQEKARQHYKEDIEKNRSRSAIKTGDILDTFEYLQNIHTDLIYLRDLLGNYKNKFQSEALKNLTLRLEKEPLDEIAEKLEEINYLIVGGKIGYTLQFGGGMKIKYATVNYFSKQEGIKSKKHQSGLNKLYYKFIKKNSIPLREEPLQRDVTHMKETAIGHLMKMFRPYQEKIMLFWQHFAEEMAFYKGVIRLMTRLDELSISLTMPEPKPIGTKDSEFKNLFELSMAIYVQRKPVGNSIELKDNLITLVTGANQGGKSTFLRSFGIAQILMQCGMAVPAEFFSAPIRTQIFTHFSRREDEQLSSGRLCEELKRMSGMIDAAETDSLFLLNESFASTTEKEGTQIAKGILRAFYEKQITTIMVTHLFQLAKYLYEKKLPHTAFLTAERKEDGKKTYHMLTGKPENTSYGMDLFKALEI